MGCNCGGVGVGVDVSWCTTTGLSAAANFDSKRCGDANLNTTSGFDDLLSLFAPAISSDDATQDFFVPSAKLCCSAHATFIQF